MVPTLFTGATLAALSSVVVLAAEDNHGEASSSGLPQLEYANWPGQIFWLLVVFGALYYAMSRHLLPKIGAVIEDRRDKIADDLDEANRLKQQSEDVEAAYEKALSDARAHAHTIAADARRELQTELDREAAEFEAEANRRADAAEARIREMTEAALAQAGDVATEAAVDLTARLGATVRRDDVARAVAAALAKG